MLTSFLHNVTLVVSFAFIFNSVSQQLCWRRKSKDDWRYRLITSILFGFLSLFMLLDPFVSNDFLFDLRSVPIYFIAFVMGWKHGLVTMVLPLLFRFYLGGRGLYMGIFSGMFIPLIVGAFGNKLVKTKGIYEVIDIKTLLILSQTMNVLRFFIWITLGLPTRLWISLSLCMAIFSTLTLACLGVMFNNFTLNNISEEKLRDSEERYRKLVEMIPDGLSIQKKGVFVYANEKLANILGVDKADKLIGRSIKDFIKAPQEAATTVHVLEEDNQKLNEVIYYEEEILSWEGNPIEVEIVETPFIEKNQKFVFSMIRDVSRQKKADKADQLLRETMEMDRLKTEFFSNISHELKTPLNIILGTIQLASIRNNQDLIYENFEKHIKIMKQNCYRLLRLINNLIDITRLDSGFLKIQRANHDIVHVVEDITLSVAKYIEGKEIGLTFDTEIEERLIACDADKIERILLNLLSNAIKFTGAGGEIYVNIYDYKDHIEIAVKDTGIGISQDNLDTIFQRFRQAEANLSKHAEGSGIGLSLVKSLVEAHGGRITVNSQEGKGSEFIIKLPVILIDEPPLSFKEVAATSSSSKVERITIEFSDIYS